MDWNRFKLTWMIRLFGITKVPMIWYCRPTVMEQNDESLSVKIPLRYRTKNHLGSMYFGVLAVGADVTGGFLAMTPIMQSKRNIALVFKDFNAEFYRRPEENVIFKCHDGHDVKALVEKCIESGERENYTLTIEAFEESNQIEVVARFKLTLSIKDKTQK